MRWAVSLRGGLHVLSNRWAWSFAVTLLVAARRPASLLGVCFLKAGHLHPCPHSKPNKQPALISVFPVGFKEFFFWCPCSSPNPLSSFGVGRRRQVRPAVGLRSRYYQHFAGFSTPRPRLTRRFKRTGFSHSCHLAILYLLYFCKLFNKRMPAA